MGTQDIRWNQRFASFSKAFKQLEDAVSLAKERSLSVLEEQGMIQAFEYTHEQAWKTLKDFLEEKEIMLYMDQRMLPELRLNWR